MVDPHLQRNGTFRRGALRGLDSGHFGQHLVERARWAARRAQPNGDDTVASVRSRFPGGHPLAPSVAAVRHAARRLSGSTESQAYPT